MENFDELHILDGSMATGLVERGVTLDTELGTAQALLTDAEAVHETHLAYLEAGAQVILANTYQANIQAFEKLGYSEQDAGKLVALALLVAKKAQADHEAQTGEHALVAGTIGPYGAYLADESDEYLLNDAQYLNFHLPRLEAILFQEPDLLFLAAQPKVSEPMAVLRWLEKYVPDLPVAVTFTLKDEATLSDGTELEYALKEITKFEQVFAVGIEDLAPSLVLKAIKNIKKETTKKVIVKPSLATTADLGAEGFAAATQVAELTPLVEKWHQAGASLFGGGHMTTPTQIKQITSYFDNLK